MFILMAVIFCAPVECAALIVEIGYFPAVGNFENYFASLVNDNRSPPEVATRAFPPINLPGLRKKI